MRCILREQGKPLVSAALSRDTSRPRHRQSGDDSALFAWLGELDMERNEAGKQTSSNRNTLHQHLLLNGFDAALLEVRSQIEAGSRYPASPS
jgi:hypothetical protein